MIEAAALVERAVALQRPADQVEAGGYRLIADFNRDWPDVTRTREMLVLAEEFVP